jgi:hypothetical protein
VTKAGGAFGIMTAIIAWYGSAAVVINSTWGRTLLPVGVFVQPKRKVVRLLPHSHNTRFIQAVSSSHALAFSG